MSNHSRSLSSSSNPLNHSNILSFSFNEKNSSRRFYKTVFENHDNEILGMFCLQSNQLLSVDSGGGVKRLNLDQLTTETLDLFGDVKITVSCVAINEEGDGLFFGLENGSIWTSDLNTSDELVYSHLGAITAIASAKLTVFTAGQDMIVKMFNLRSQSLVANISCAKEITTLKPLTNIYGSPVIVADITGCVSVWSPHLLKKSVESVQFCCHMQSRILSLIQLTLFHRNCIVCTTSNKIKIYCITELDPSRDQQERISIFKDETYSLVRSISPPDDSIQFTSCYSMDSYENKVNSNLNSLLFASSSNGYVYLLEPISGQMLRKYQITSPGIGGYIPCMSMIYLPMYQILAVTDQKNSLYLVNPSSTPLVDSIPTSSLTITCVTATDEHSAIIAYGDSDGLVHLSSNVSNFTHSKPLVNSQNPPLTSVTAVAIVLLEAKEELVIISGHSNGLLQAYVCSIDGVVPRLETARVNQIPNIYQTRITAIQNVPSSAPSSIASDRIATASEFESIIIWKLNSTGIIKVTQLPDSLRIQSLLVHPEGYLVGNDANSRLNLWNIHDNWKKIITHSTQTFTQNSRDTTQSNQLKETDSDYEIAKIGLMFDSKKNTHYVLSTNLNYDKIKYWKIRGKNQLYLDAIVELPQRFANIHFWGNGESNLIFLQSEIAGKSLIYSMNIQLAASSDKLVESSTRYFISSSGINGQSCQLLGVTGDTSPIVITIERGSQSPSLLIWNNDLHDQDQFYQSGILQAMEQYTSYQLNKNSKSSQRLTEGYLWNLVESHPSFPGCLLVPDIDLTGKYQNLFASALLANYPSFLQKYLPMVSSIALSQSSLYLNRRKSLLYVALKLKDISAINLLLQLWSKVISQNANSLNEKGPEVSQYHVMELFDDLKILSREFPAQYSEFIQKLEIPLNHSITQKNCPTKALTSSFSSSSSPFTDCWMRGTEFRVIPSFWSNEKNTEGLFNSASAPFPDLMARMMATPEEETHWLSYEQPHRCPSLQQVHTPGIEHYDHLNATVSEGQHLALTSYGAGPLKIEADDLDKFQSNPLVSSNAQAREGILVQAHVHPIPFAAAGVEFLRICQRTAQLTGQKNLLSCPIVATIIDYKWNTSSSTSYSRYIFHYLFLFILYSFLCIYYDQMTSAPHKTGLPILAWIVSFLLIWNYFLLCLQIIFRLLSDGYQICFLDPWFYYGLVTYFMAMTGIFMALFHNDNEDERQELSHRTSFNSRSVLSAASILLSIQFLYTLMPLQSIGPFIQRLFLTIQSLFWNFLLLFFCIISFSVSFNLFHHRASYSHDDELVTYSSFYGSVLQSFLYVFGGYSADSLFDQADSPLLMSIYFIVFIVVMIWILILYLLLTALEVYRHNESLAICLWRENQLRIILQNSSLLGEEMASNVFHNPKWLQILIPSHQAHRLQPLSSSSSCCNCECNKEVKQKAGSDLNDSVEEIRRDMDLLKDILYQLHHSIDSLPTSSGSPRVIQQSTCSCNCPSEEQLLRRIEDLLQQYHKPPPPVEPSPLPPVKISPRRDILEVRTMSKTDEEVIRPPLDTTPTNKKKGDSGIRVRQIKASKKKLSSQISGLDYDES